jgi:hypothetical protein
MPPAVNSWFSLSLFPLLIFGSVRSNWAEEPIDFLRQVKPLLVEYCGNCHGAEDHHAGLRLDSAGGIREGGDRGAVVVAGQPDNSRLLSVLLGANDEPVMPPEGEPRPSSDQIELIRNWILAGADLPEDDRAADARRKHADHWSLQPVRRPPLPDQPLTPSENASSSRGKNSSHPIDLFVAQAQRERGLTAAPPADRYTLIRRLSLDLTGFPPTIEEVNDFVQDARPDAYQRLVERLLASPHYGERWGRLWLDLARYADSNGYTRDMPREIWKYRDWVVESLNRNLPFDQFVIEQLAGDLLDNPTWDQLVATGFHRNTLFNEEGGTDPEQFRVERTVDRVNTTGTVFLGLSIGCAQCHDHKYDPISQREYYQLYAFFNNADETNLDVPSTRQISEGAVERRAEIRQQVARLREKFSPRQDELEQFEIAWEKGLTEEEKQQLPFQVLNAINLPRAERTEALNGHLDAYFATLPFVRQQFPLLEQIYQLEQVEPKFASTMILRESKTPRETYLQVRGDFLQPGVPVTSNTPRVLPEITPRGEVADRLDLARWLVAPQQPLTPRVTVNRIWQQYFGQGLVETENDFGIQGTPPTHPELLDWLSAEFVDSGWDLKELHRQIVTSATYQQASAVPAAVRQTDPQNIWLTRQSRLRLDAELLRDSALSASGLLTYRLGGPSVYPPQPEGVFEFTQDKKPWPTAEGADRWRRAMYTFLWRSSPYPALAVFDFPDANVSCTRRTRANTPLQSLTLANDATFVEFAQGLARRTLDEPLLTKPECNKVARAVLDEDTRRIERMFRWVLTRPPEAAELSRLLTLLQGQRDHFQQNREAALLVAGSLGPVKSSEPGPVKVELAAWVSVARVLLNVDEFVTRE